jgi:hypothetical protein
MLYWLWDKTPSGLKFSCIFNEHKKIMPTTCLNCGAEIQQQFCPYCGQNKDVEKFNWHSIVHELTHFFTHIEKGFLNTSLQLLIRPGRVIREYLEGKRKKYHKPVGFFLIWAAIRLVTYSAVSGLMHYENLRRFKEEQAYLVHYNQFFGLLLIPIEALFIWIIVSRRKLNYFETLIVIIYGAAIIEMLIALQILIVGLLLQRNFLTNSFVIEVQLVYIIWSSYYMMDLFKANKIKLLFPRILFSLIISFLIYNELSTLIIDFILSQK